MTDAYFYLALSGLLTIVLWTPYIFARLLSWGLPTFLNNYSADFPKTMPEQPLWAARAQRAHLNMVETMPAFIAVVLGATMLANGSSDTLQSVNDWAAIFFYARLVHAGVYILGVPYLRTPVYLVSWVSVLMIGGLAIL